MMTTQWISAISKQANRVALMVVIAGGILSYPSLTAQGQDACSMVGSLGWYETRNATIKQEQWARLIKLLKYDTESSYSSSKSLGASVGIPVGDVLITLGLNDDETGFRSFRESKIDYTNNEYFNKFQSYKKYQTISEAAAKIVEKCVERPGVYASLSYTKDNREFGINVWYRLYPGVASVDVSVKPGNGVTCKESKLTLAANKTLSNSFTCSTPGNNSSTLRVQFKISKGALITPELLIPPLSPPLPSQTIVTCSLQTSWGAVSTLISRGSSVRWIGECPGAARSWASAELTFRYGNTGEGGNLSRATCGNGDRADLCYRLNIETNGIEIDAFHPKVTSPVGGNHAAHSYSKTFSGSAKNALVNQAGHVSVVIKVDNYGDRGETLGLNVKDVQLTIRQ